MQPITKTCVIINSDTKIRNDVCDKTMINELNGIMNSTLRERIDKAIVGKLIRAKVNLLMSLQRNFTNK